MGRHTEGMTDMAEVIESIDVVVPVRTAYNQWTQFEQFPRSMDGVQSVQQLDDRHLHWAAEIAGKREEWDAEITEQNPDERIAWTSTGGALHAGVVTFHRIDDDQSRVMLQMEFEPEDFKEKAADALGLVKSRVKGDLKKFKGFIENRDSETGEWRGEVQQDRV